MLLIKRWRNLDGTRLVCIIGMKKDTDGICEDYELQVNERESILTSRHNDKRKESLREEKVNKRIHFMYQLAVTKEQLNGRVKKDKKPPP